MDPGAPQCAVSESKEVLSRHLPSFYRYALRLLGNTADAEDAVQDALLAAYRHIDQFRGQSRMTTWLTAIIRNCALMQLRKAGPDSFVFRSADGRGKILHLGDTHQDASQPGRRVSQLGTQCTPATMQHAVVACSAENISAACRDGFLGLCNSPNLRIATRHDQGSTGTSAATIARSMRPALGSSSRGSQRSHR